MRRRFCYQFSQRLYNILAIESSFDDTAITILNTHSKDFNSMRESQHQFHSPFKGLVPKFSSALHESRFVEMLASSKALEFNYIACTRGPGQLNSLGAGCVLARTLKAISGKPLLWINHMVCCLLTICRQGTH